MQAIVATQTSGPDDRYRLVPGARRLRAAFIAACVQPAGDRSRSCRPSWRASCSRIFDAITACVTSRLSRSPRDSEASTQSSSALACSARGAFSSSASSPNATPASISVIASRLGLALPADQHAARDDDVERLTLLALVEDDLALEEAALVQQAVDDAQLEPRQRREQRELPERAQTRRFLAALEES